jgi:hypothetical protein
MTWLTWRQHRSEIAISLVIILIFVFFLRSSVTTIVEYHERLGPGYVEGFLDRQMRLPLLLPISALPLLLGMFVGAPLVAREIEQGTYRLVWTQGLTRQRWFLVKVALLGVAFGLVFGVLAAVLTWWNQFVAAAVGPWLTFDTNGPVVIAYALFGLALGIALGSFVGKPIPAMALVIPLFIIVRVLFTGLRPGYLPPQTFALDYAGASNLAKVSDQSNWIVRSQMLDRSGNPLFYSLTQVKDEAGNITNAYGPGDCPWMSTPLIDSNAIEQKIDQQRACFREHGYSELIYYHPNNRFWIFQAIESSLFLILSFGLIGLAFWKLKKLP